AGFYVGNLPLSGGRGGLTDRPVGGSPAELAGMGYLPADIVAHGPAEKPSV
ncbi:MAG: hypothetical protein QOD72_2671, partial [Acidimicrobiaceae bacterium]|nr:hypothetical protein [Acidimicrobiaceae bacterium]